MTGFQLKLLAMIAMTLDHIGCIFFPRLPLLRMIGRLAMPILCFFIGEGLRHTRNPQKYLLRLVGFALISELPFDLAFYGRVNWASQNVYFTLALGLMALRLLQSSSPRRWAGLLAVGGAALLLRADYGLYGIAMILLLDRFRDSTYCCCGDWEVYDKTTRRRILWPNKRSPANPAASSMTT